MAEEVEHLEAEPSVEASVDEHDDLNELVQLDELSAAAEELIEEAVKEISDVPSV